MSTAVAASPSLSLYKIEEELSQLLDLRDQAIEDGALPDELAAIDEQITSYFVREVKKADNICEAIFTLEAMEEAANKAIERMSKLKNAWKSRRERIKASALAAMQAHGVTKVETATHRLRIQANGGVAPLEIDQQVYQANGNGELDKFTVTMPYLTWCKIVHGLATEDDFKELERIGRLEPDNDRVREALKQGKEVPGARLGARGQHLRVE